MTSVHETAYPRFKPELTQRELDEIYTPTDNEQRFARKLGKTVSSRLYLLILLKAVQRLGYSPLLADVPPAIISFLTKSMGARPIAMRDMLAEKKSQSRRRFIDAIRIDLEIQPLTEETDQAIQLAATQAAQTKQD